MQLGRRKTQGLGNAKRRFERQRRVEFSGGLAEFEKGSRIRPGQIEMNGDFDDAGARMLPVRAVASPAQGKQHRMRRHGRVSYEGHLLAGVEETQPNVIVRAVRCEHEGHFGV